MAQQEIKIPTAKEFFIEALKEERDSHSDFEYLLIEFAKLHVQKALKEASKKALTTWSTTDFYDNTKIVSKGSILNAYPLKNIK